MKWQLITIIRTTLSQGSNIYINKKNKKHSTPFIPVNKILNLTNFQILIKKHVSISNKWYVISKQIIGSVIKLNVYYNVTYNMYIVF